MEARVELHGGLLRGTVWTHIFLGENELYTFLGYIHTYILYYLSFKQAFSKTSQFCFSRLLIVLLYHFQNGRQTRNSFPGPKSYRNFRATLSLSVFWAELSYGKLPHQGPIRYPVYILFDSKGTPFVYLPLKNDAFFTYLSNSRLGTN